MVKIVSSTQPHEEVTLRPRLNFCPVCKTPLRKKWVHDRRMVYTLEGVLSVKRVAYNCPNETCQRYDVSVLPLRQWPKNISVGWDVIAYIGIRRKKRDTLTDIQESLELDYGLFMCVKTVANLADVYLQFIGNKPHPDDLAKIRESEGAIITIDGIQPQMGNVVLYIIRDIVSDTVLVARTLQNSATEHLVPLFKEVQAMNLPIIGLVSDKQISFVLGINQVFPDLPHQYCQAHYIMDISEEFEEVDRSLRKNMRSRLGAIYRSRKTFEGQVKRGLISKEACAILDEIYECVRAIARQRQHYPFKPVGIPLYENLQVLERILTRIDKTHPLKTLKTVIRHVRSILKDFHDRYNFAQGCFAIVCDIQKLLETNNYSVSHDNLREYVTTQLTNANDQNREWLQRVLEVSLRYLPGLFEHLKHDKIPPTNNDMERYIRDFKGDLARQIGRKFVHRFLLKRGEYLCFARQVPAGEDLYRLKENGDMPSKESRERFEALRNRSKLERRATVNFEKELERLADAWDALFQRR